MAKHTAVGQIAPDFELTDVTGRAVHLSDYAGEKTVILVFTRGFL
jgi:peroxiredoxin